MNTTKTCLNGVGPVRNLAKATVVQVHSDTLEFQIVCNCSLVFVSAAYLFIVTTDIDGCRLFR